MWPFVRTSRVPYSDGSKRLPFPTVSLFMHVASLQGGATRSFPRLLAVFVLKDWSRASSTGSRGAEITPARLHHKLLRGVKDEHPWLWLSPWPLRNFRSDGVRSKLQTRLYFCADHVRTATDTTAARKHRETALEWSRCRLFGGRLDEIRKSAFYKRHKVARWSNWCITSTRATSSCAMNEWGSVAAPEMDHTDNCVRRHMRCEKGKHNIMMIFYHVLVSYWIKDNIQTNDILTFYFGTSCNSVWNEPYKIQVTCQIFFTLGPDCGPQST